MSGPVGFVSNASAASVRSWVIAFVMVLSGLLSVSATELYLRSLNPRMHWNQAPAGRVEILPHVGSVAQTSVEVVRPLMIRTYQHADRRLPSHFQTSATMAADVAVSSDILVVAAHDDDGSLADINGRNVARLGNIRRDPDQNPVLVKKYIDIRFKNVLAAKEFAWHAVTRPTASD